MRRLLFSVLLLLCTYSVSAQGIPFYRNYTAEDYHANKINYDIEIDDEGIVYVANFEGLMYYDHARWRMIHTPDITRITVTVRTSDNTIWVGGYNYFGKIEKEANGELSLKRVGKPNLFIGEVSEIYERDGKIQFIVNDGTIFQVDGENVTVKKKVKKESLRIGMLDVVNVDAVEKGERDVVLNDITNEEALGYGLKAQIKKNKGLIIVNDIGEPLYTINADNGLCSNDIVYTAYDKQGLLWGATAKGIFAIQMPSSFSRYTSFEGLTGTVLSIERLNNHFYVGTDDGLFRHEGKRFVRVTGVNHTCWMLSKSGECLLAATADGIYRIAPNGTARQLTTINSMAVMDDGNQFYSGEFDGVYLIQMTNLSRKKVCKLENVTRIEKDANGTIWLQSLYGSIWYKPVGFESFQLYKSGKKNETMQTIVRVNGKMEVICAEDTKPFPYPLFSYSDNTGVTWLTDNEGKNLYRWKDGRQLNDMNELLAPFHESTIRALYKYNDEILIGGETGLAIINLKAGSPLSAAKPKLHIRSVVLNSEKVLWGGFGKMPELLKLEPDEQNLTFTYSISSAPIIGSNLYRYRLNNGSWSAWSTKCEANFINLPYGSYTFSVEAKDAMNRMSNIASIKFSISPPFYHRWYMNLFYLIIAMAFVFFLLRLRLRKLEKDKVRLENLIQERTAEVVRLEKMATAGKLTQGLIDRILNPLNYINNFAKLSEGLVKDVKANVEDEKGHMDEENYEDTMDVLDMLGGNLQKVSEHGQNTTRTLKAMEEMLKDRSGGIIETDLTFILKQNKEMMEKYYAQEMTNHHIRLTFDTPTHELPIQANPEQLSKTFMSIFANSIYAMVKKAQRTVYEPELSTRVTTNGKTITIEIRDNGIGIEQTIINKIFDPFFTTKPTGEASGVGLYLAHEVIQNYGGDIRVNSVKDEFSEFTITLPALMK